MLKGKSLLEYANLFSPYDYQKNDKCNNTKIFSIIKKMEILYWVICGKYRTFEKLKIPYLLEKTLPLLFAGSVKMKMKKYLKKKNQLKY